MQFYCLVKTVKHLIPHWRLFYTVLFWLISSDALKHIEKSQLISEHQLFQFVLGAQICPEELAVSLASAVLMLSVLQEVSSSYQSNGDTTLMLQIHFYF